MLSSWIDLKLLPELEVQVPTISQGCRNQYLLLCFPRADDDEDLGQRSLQVEGEWTMTGGEAAK